MEVSYGTIIIIIIFSFVSTWSLCTHSHIVAQYGGRGECGSDGWSLDRIRWSAVGGYGERLSYKDLTGGSVAEPALLL